jgi:hypothetical protein
MAQRGPCSDSMRVATNPGERESAHDASSGIWAIRRLGANPQSRGSYVAPCLEFPCAQQESER